MSVYARGLFCFRSRPLFAALYVLLRLAHFLSNHTQVVAMVKRAVSSFPDVRMALHEHGCDANVTHFFDANFVDSIVKDNDAARWNGINRLSFSDDDYDKVRGASVECLFPSRIVFSSFFFS